MTWITPVTERTEFDVEAAKSLKERIYTVGWVNLTAAEQMEFLGDMIGTLNHITLNRIECNTCFLEELIRSLGFAVQKLAYKKDWSRESLPVRNDLQRLVDNIAALCDSFYAMATSLPENMEIPDIAKMNAVEEVLVELKAAADLIIQSWKYCGTFSCGQDLVLPQRS